MASYFGEVIFPVSRAFWNGEDEDEDDDDDDDYEIQDIENIKDTINFVINWVESEPSTLDKLLVVEGEMTVLVTKCLLDNAKVVCTIEHITEKESSNIYYLDNGLYICNVNKKVDLVQAAEFTVAIAPILSKSTHLYTLKSDHIINYKTDEEIDSVSFLKCLCSSKSEDSNDNVKIPLLDMPNFVTGVCAGVLTHADISDLHCIMYILYIDTFVLDSKNALPLVELFSDLFGITLNLKPLSLNFFNKGNLYM